MILVVDHPCHSWIQAAIISGYITLRGSWTLFLGIYEIIAAILKSALVPFTQFQAIYSAYADIVGIVVVIVTFLGAAALGIVVATLYSLYLIRILQKFRKLLKSRKAKVYADNADENQAFNPVQDNSEEKNPNAADSQASKKGKKTFSSNFLNCCSRLFGSTMGNFELAIGIQMISNDKIVDGAVFEDLIDERVLEDLKRENTNLVLTLLVFLATRRKMEKKKRVATQPVFSELMVLLFKKGEAMIYSISPKLRFEIITSNIIIFSSSLEFINY